MEHVVREIHGLQQPQRLQLPLAKMLLDISGALMYLHASDPQIVHADIKCDNIRVQRDCAGVTKGILLDFGLSRLLTAQAKPLGGTPSWKAPELFSAFDGNKAPPSPSADVYSFGLLAYYTMTGVGVAASFDPGHPHGRFKRLDWPVSSVLRSNCQAMTKCCMEPDPVQRPPIGEVRDEILRWIREMNAGDAELGPGVMTQLSTVGEWGSVMSDIRHQELLALAPPPTDAAAPPPADPKPAAGRTYLNL